MIKGELIVAIIKSLGYNGEEKLDPKTISMQDDYFEVSHNIWESVNRALTRIYDANKMPKEVFYINRDTISKNDKRTFYARYYLPELIDNFGKVNSVTYEDEDTGIYGANPSVRFEGRKTIVLERLNTLNERYIIIYTPKLNTIKYLSSLDTDEIEFPEEIVDKVIYFVKSEFLEETNASMSAYYKNLFEKYLEEYDEDNNDVIRKTRDVYHMF